MLKRIAGKFSFPLFSLILFLFSSSFGQSEWITQAEMKKDLADGSYQDLMKHHDYDLALLKQDGNSPHLGRFYGALSRWENLEGLEKWVKAEPGNAVAWTAVGEACLNKGENYRGNDTIDKVPEGNIKNFEDYMKKARPYFEYALKLNPDDPTPYLGLMGIELNEGTDKKKMWDYFHKAIQIAPRCQEAIWTMGLDCSPLWGGSAAEMRQFTGQYCLTAPKGNYLRLFLVRCDEDIWHAQGSQNAYWGNTPAWQECKQEFEDYLAAHPKDLQTRSWYSFFAYFGRHYREAKEQFDILGDHWNANSAHWLLKDGYFKARDYANRHANDPNQGEFVENEPSIMPELR